MYRNWLLVYLRGNFSFGKEAPEETGRPLAPPQGGFCIAKVLKVPIVTERYRRHVVSFLPQAKIVKRICKANLLGGTDDGKWKINRKDAGMQFRYKS